MISLIAPPSPHCVRNVQRWTTRYHILTMIIKCVKKIFIQLSDTTNWNLWIVKIILDSCETSRASSFATLDNLAYSWKSHTAENYEKKKRNVVKQVEIKPRSFVPTKNNRSLPSTLLSRTVVPAKITFRGRLAEEMNIKWTEREKSRVLNGQISSRIAVVAIYDHRCTRENATSQTGNFSACDMNYLIR